MPFKKGQIAPRMNDKRRVPMCSADMAGQPRYKIGIRGKPFYFDETTGEWLLSSRDISEVKRLVEYQQNPAREQHMLKRIERDKWN